MVVNLELAGKVAKYFEGTVPEGTKLFCTLKPKLLEGVKLNELKLLKNDTLELSKTQANTMPKFKIGNKLIPDKIRNQITIALQSESLNKELAIKLFEQKTGLKLHIPTTNRLEIFDETLGTVINLKEIGQFPEDIKHIIIGHGKGDSRLGNWVFNSDGELKNELEVFKYINNNIPLNEKILLSTCETTGISPIGKPGIGKPCTTNLLDKNEPGKIIQSGTNKIIGDFAQGTANYY